MRDHITVWFARNIARVFPALRRIQFRAGRGNNLLRLYEKIDLRADINSTFVKEGITVTSVNVDSGKLEDYFTELVGGEGIG